MNTMIVAKTLIFNEDGKLLRIRRSKDDNHRPNGTDIPGGKIDAGEGILDGAVREIREEIGISIDQAAMQLSFCYCHVDYNADVDNDVNIVWLGFITTLPQGQEIHLSHEHQGYEWLPISEALNGNDSTSMEKFIGHVKSIGLAKELWDITPRAD